MQELQSRVEKSGTTIWGGNLEKTDGQTDRKTDAQTDRQGHL